MKLEIKKLLFDIYKYLLTQLLIIKEKNSSSGKRGDDTNSYNFLNLHRKLYQDSPLIDVFHLL